MKNQNYSDDIDNVYQTLEQVYQKIQALDKKCQELEKANQRIIVTGSKFNPQPKPINISEEELINIYNYTPQILAEYAVSVSITADTYREKTQGNIYLEFTNNGYYWVILREQNNEIFYHLVPNVDRTLKLYRLQNHLKSLFIIQGKIESNSHNFTIEKLANLQILSSGYSWQLMNKGIIKIGIFSPVNKLLNELQKMNTQSGKVPNNITNLLTLVKEDHQNLKILQEQQKKVEKYVFETINKFLELKNKLEENFNLQKQEIKQLKQREEKFSQQINLIDQKTNNLQKSFDILSVNIDKLASIVQEEHKNLSIVKNQQQNLEKYITETINKFLELKNKLETNISELEIKLNYQKDEIKQLKNQ